MSADMACISFKAYGFPAMSFVWNWIPNQLAMVREHFELRASF